MSSYRVILHVTYEGPYMEDASSLNEACEIITRLGEDLHAFELLKLSDDQPDIFEVMEIWRTEKVKY
jgi:hypothetical protein